MPRCSGCCAPSARRAAGLGYRRRNPTCLGEASEDENSTFLKGNDQYLLQFEQHVTIVVGVVIVIDFVIVVTDLSPSSFGFAAQP